MSEQNADPGGPREQTHAGFDAESARPLSSDEHRPDLDLFGRAAPTGRDWSHRRGEPRIFAFFWTLYLLLATIAAFWSVGAPGTSDPLALRPAARSVLAAV